MKVKNMMGRFCRALRRPTICWRIRADVAVRSTRSGNPVTQISMRSDREYPLFTLARILLAMAVLLWLFGRIRNFCRALLGK